MARETGPESGPGQPSLTAGERQAAQTLPPEYMDIVLRRGGGALASAIGAGGPGLEAYRRYRDHCASGAFERSARVEKHLKLLRHSDSLPPEERAVVDAVVRKRMKTVDAAQTLRMDAARITKLFAQAQKRVRHRLDNHHLLPYRDRFPPWIRPVVEKAASGFETHREIAEDLGIAEETVSSALTQARHIARRLGRQTLSVTDRRRIESAKPLLAYLEKMPPQKRAGVQAIAGDGLGLKQAAARLGLPAKKVRDVLSEARRQFGADTPRAAREKFVLDHIELVPAKRREAIVLLARDKLPARAVAERLGLPAPTVGGYLVSAERHIRKQIRRRDADEIRREECRLLLAHPRLLTAGQRLVVREIAGKGASYGKAARRTEMGKMEVRARWREAVTVIRALSDEQLLADAASLPEPQQGFLARALPDFALKP